MESSDIQAEENPYFTVSTYKLSVMYIMTLGLYAVYWFYKNWKLQQPHVEKNIWPVWRGVFSIFFAHSLLERVRITAESKSIATNYSHSLMATVFVSLVVLGNIVGMFDQNEEFGIFSIISFTLSMVALYPLRVVQQTVNQINNDPHGVFNDDMTIINNVFIVIGAVIWFFVVVAALASFGIINLA